MLALVHNIFETFKTMESIQMERRWRQEHLLEL